jgi:hypothetical protein
MSKSCKTSSLIYSRETQYDSTAKIEIIKKDKFIGRYNLTDIQILQIDEIKHSKLSLLQYEWRRMLRLDLVDIRLCNRSHLVCVVIAKPAEVLSDNVEGHQHEYTPVTPIYSPFFVELRSTQEGNHHSTSETNVMHKPIFPTWVLVKQSGGLHWPRPATKLI